MGLCFSKQQQSRRRREEEQPCNEPKKIGSGKKAGAKAVAVVSEAKKAPQVKPAPSKKTAEEPAADKRTVFVVKAAAAAAAAEVAAAASGDADEVVKRAVQEEEAKPVVVSRVPVRTSSCTKEEVDAILIQCGRLSRSSSSSGKVGSGEGGGGGHRRYSESKRSYDFDRERRGGGVDDDGDWERQGVGAGVSRPSPRRRTPERKRSESHERSGGSGSRRVSRSPGRRGDSVPATASSGGGGERSSRQQPGKMVSVPAREKGRAPSPVPAAAASAKRYPSPRSNSPARAAGNENAAVQPAHGPSLSRSSSRKAEQSPYRRNPMAELDENTLGNHSNGRPQKKSTDSVGALPQKVAERGKEHPPASRPAKKIVQEATVASDTKLGNSGRMKATHTVSIVAESAVNPKGRSSRRSSRDFDNNGNWYASLLLEDIQNYHQQNTGAGGAAAPAPAFSLPACVSKACSILEAVADLNSSSSENRSFELDRSANDKCSANGRYGNDAAGGGGGTVVVESEVVVKDDLMEPSLHKYVSVRDPIRGVEADQPEESAGSNSFAGNAWTPSWEPGSVDSTDRSWTASQSNNGDEVEQVSPLEMSWQSKQKLPSRVGSTTSSAQRGRSAHRGGGGAVNARSDVRAAPASSSVV
uniref:Uncharacterized protein n=1 Tax=Leersia perrieri TaxID=77586 RepID=A0A0D9W7F0_9ORYZ